MVSFFGLKLGGDKKKKSGQTNDHRDSQSKRKLDQSTLDNDQFFGNDLTRPGTYEASIYSTNARPGSSYSLHRRKKSAGQKSVYTTNEPHNLASLAYHDIGSRPATSYAPSFSKLTAGFNSQWNGSIADLPAPPVLGSGSRRPSVSSVKSARQKAWVNPLDIHFGRRDSSASAIVQPTQGLRPSPLANRETLAAPPLPTAPAVPARSPLRRNPRPLPGQSTGISGQHRNWTTASASISPLNPAQEMSDHRVQPPTEMPQNSTRPDHSIQVPLGLIRSHPPSLSISYQR
ncbi:hypothetical protein PG984_010863 [Apiospora sp. TS-2023a]